MIQMAPFGRKLQPLLARYVYMFVSVCVCVWFGLATMGAVNFVVGCSVALYIVFEVISQLAVVAT